MIGGEFEINPNLIPSERGEELIDLLGLQPDKVAFFGAAREAVYWWARHLKPPGPVLVPAYCCWSVVQPYRAAGVPYRYYRVNRQLQVDRKHLETLLDGAAALQVVHYFGTPAEPWLFKLGVPILEDAVQAVLSPDLRCNGSWAIGSFRKFLPVADGAFLSAAASFVGPSSLEPAIGGAYGEKLYARMQKFAALGRGDRQTWFDAIELTIETERRLNDEPIRCHAMSERTAKFLRGAPLAQLAHARQQNYQVLFDCLFPLFCNPKYGCKALLGALHPDTVPYGLPILADRRDGLREFLELFGICSVVHWELPSDIGRTEFPDSWFMAGRLLTLPVDQRYDPRGMERVAKAVKDFYGG